MANKNFFPGHLTKMTLQLRIKSLRMECGLSYELPFDWEKQTRSFLVSYHNQLIDTYQVNTNVFEYVK